jgi:UDP-N-acetylglucosamine transferase subunit ALG13
VIFVSVGSIHFPFDRLVSATADLAGDVFVQHGTAELPAGVRGVPFLSCAEMAEAMAEADAVVTHAGVGSILLAREHGHVPVVMPRMKKHGETVDDHQVAFAEVLAEDGTVVMIRDGLALPRAVADAQLRRGVQAHVEAPVHIAVREALAA